RAANIIVHVPALRREDRRGRSRIQRPGVNCRKPGANNCALKTDSWNSFFTLAKKSNSWHLQKVLTSEERTPELAEPTINLLRGQVRLTSRACLRASFDPAN